MHIPYLAILTYTGNKPVFIDFCSTFNFAFTVTFGCALVGFIMACAFRMVNRA